MRSFSRRTSLNLDNLYSVILIFFLIGFFSLPSFSQMVFEGKVIDQSDEGPIMYATVGVKGKNAATVADSKGRFRVFFPRFVKQTDTVVISSIGFNTVEMPVSDAIEISEFRLEPLPKILPPVEVYGFANKGTSLAAFGELSFFRGWYSYKTGGEIGKIISLPHKVYKIDKIFFKVDNKYDTCLVRLHIRNVENSWPGQELLTEEFIIPVFQLSITDQPCVFDLSQYNLVLKEKEVFIGFEVIECSSSSQPHSSLSFVGTENGDYLFKQYATAYWTKENNFSIYFGLNLQY